MDRENYITRIIDSKIKEYQHLLNVIEKIISPPKSELIIFSMGIAKQRFRQPLTINYCSSIISAIIHGNVIVAPLTAV